VIDVQAVVGQGELALQDTFLGFEAALTGEVVGHGIEQKDGLAADLAADVEVDEQRVVGVSRIEPARAVGTVAPLDAELAYEKGNRINFLVSCGADCSWDCSPAMGSNLMRLTLGLRGR